MRLWIGFDWIRCADIDSIDRLNTGFEASTRENLPYQLKGAAVLCRLPTVLPPLPEWQIRFENYAFEKRQEEARMQRTLADVDRIIREQSSKKELKKAKKADAKAEAAQARGTTGTFLDEDEMVASEQAARLSAARDEQVARDAHRHALRYHRLDPGDRVLLGSRTTPADRTNDRRTLQRALASRLYLLVKRPGFSGSDAKIDSDGLPVWQFPYGDWVEGESLRKVRSGALRSEQASCTR